MVRRAATLVVLCLSVMGLTAQSAWAANVHFKKGSPVFTDKGLFLNATGSLTGLGNGDVVVGLTATGQPTATCTNPAGQTQPAGQNPVEVTLGGVEALPAADIKNGNLSFNVNTAGPATPVPGAPDCPNSHWREDFSDVIFAGHSATITVYQPCTDTTIPIDCTAVLTQTFSL